jgi:hypothetical protein
VLIVSIALKLNKFVVMTMNPGWGETPHYVWAVDAQDAVDKVKDLCSPDEEIMDVYKAVKGWKK